MHQTIEDVDNTVLDALDEEWEIACDYGPGRQDGPPLCNGMQPAYWIAKARCPECALTAQRLICKACKELVTTTEHGCWCGGCQARIVPFRRVFVYFTQLRRD